jgi:hypothetical protein
MAVRTRVIAAPIRRSWTRPVTRRRVPDRPRCTGWSARSYPWPGPSASSRSPSVNLPRARHSVLRSYAARCAPETPCERTLCVLNEWSPITRQGDCMTAAEAPPVFPRPTNVACPFPVDLGGAEGDCGGPRPRDQPENGDRRATASVGCVAASGSPARCWLHGRGRGRPQADNPATTAATDLRPRPATPSA